MEEGQEEKDTFGAYLKKKREALGYSQGQIVAKTGLNRATISRYEHSLHLPRKGTPLEIYLKALKIPPDEYEKLALAHKMEVEEKKLKEDQEGRAEEEQIEKDQRRENNLTEIQKEEDEEVSQVEPLYEEMKEGLRTERVAPEQEHERMNQPKKWSVHILMHRSLLWNTPQPDEEGNTSRREFPTRAVYDQWHQEMIERELPIEEKIEAVYTIPVVRKYAGYQRRKPMLDKKVFVTVVHEGQHDLDKTSLLPAYGNYYRGKPLEDIDYNWGYTGGGPTLLAESMMSDYFKALHPYARKKDVDAFVLKFADNFKMDFVAWFDKAEWELWSGAITAWLKEEEAWFEEEAAKGYIYPHSHHTLSDIKNGWFGWAERWDDYKGT